VAPNVPGFLAAAGLVGGVAPVWSQVYTYAWFVGFLLSGGLYWGLERGRREPR
jgi:NCS1 family nucleobase:cation symporter-1